MNINPNNVLASVIVILSLFASEIALASNTLNSIDLLAGVNKRVSLIEEERDLSWQKSILLEKEGEYRVTFRAIFEVDDPDIFTFLALKKPLRMNGLTLNGEKIPQPFDDMRYKVIPGIPSSLLKKGKNILQATWIEEVKPKTDKKTSKGSIVARRIYSSAVSLFGLMPAALTFQTGPVLGYAGEDFFTVSCRVNMPAEVVLEVNNKQYVSKTALLHSFKIEGLSPDKQYDYFFKTRLSPKSGVLATVGPYTVKTLPADSKFSFTLLGDSRSYPENWKKIAAAVVKEQPGFTIFIGDNVTDGRRDHLWDDEFFGQAHELFATIPSFTVIGNHEKNSSLFKEFFQSPRAMNWSQEIGSVHFIGINGAMNWKKGTKRTKWLEATLAKSTAKFIFLVSHYPAWTSGKYGRLNDEGQPKGKSIRQAQHVIMPLLEKYHATAMLAGHEHFYERSESDEGVSVVISGGAGVWLSDKVDTSEKQNPFSKVFARKHHYCLFTVKEDVCTMEVVSPDGELIDTFSWSARKGLH